MVAAWITRTDLPAGLPGGEVELDAAAAAASAVLFALSGRRWAGHATRTIEIRPSVSRYQDASATWLAVPVICAGEVRNHTGCERPPAIRLPDSPVRAITEVTVDGQVRAPATYRLIGNRYLEDAWDGWAVCGCSAPMTVTYDYGAEPPAPGRAAAVRLAAELARLAAGESTALPGYVKQRVRQGETITYVDAATLFKDGKTGLGDVDLWLAAANPAGLRRPARAWSPDTDPHYTTTGGPTP